VAHFTCLHQSSAEDGRFEALRVSGFVNNLKLSIFCKNFNIIGQIGPVTRKTIKNEKTTLMFLKLQKKRRFSKLNLSVLKVMLDSCGYMQGLSS
jgi:hypothetical protein